MRKISTEKSPIFENGVEINSSRAPSSNELDFETQSFTSKEEIINQQFKPFQNERDSTGKLINQNAELAVNQNKKFNFLTGQQIILKTNASRLQHSTTHLLGLNQRAITADDKQKNMRQPLKNFKLNLQADQGFIKQFREFQKQYKPSTQMNCAFLATKRDYFYRDNKVPGPGVYQAKQFSGDTHPIEFPKSPQISKQRDNYCQKDFYDFSKTQKNINVPTFERTISREGAYQRSIFAQIEIQKRQDRTLEKDEMFNEQKIDREIEYLHQQQQRYGKGFNFQKNQELNIQVKRFQQPEVLHFQWTKMLDRYGFRKQGGKLLKQKTQSNSHL